MWVVAPGLPESPHTWELDGDVYGSHLSLTLDRGVQSHPLFHFNLSTPPPHFVTPQYHLLRVPESRVLTSKFKVVTKNDRDTGTQ